MENETGKFCASGIWCLESSRETVGVFFVNLYLRCRETGTTFASEFDFDRKIYLLQEFGFSK
jgi:hypothetical protein